MAEIIVSYRREDAHASAGRLYDRLSQRFGEESVFFDVEAISVGEDYRRAVTDTIASAKVLLAVIGTRWLTVETSQGDPRLEDPDDDVRLEIAAALQSGLPIFPVLVEGADMPKDRDLPGEIAALAYRNALRIDPVRFHRDVDDLVAALERALEAPLHRKALEGIANLERQIADEEQPFDVFIAYSRAHDFKLASVIMAALHDIGRAASARRPLRVFHDEQNLKLGQGMWPTLEQGLENSEYLLLLASPMAASSSWTDREIKHFVSSHTYDRVLIALTEGDLFWDVDAGDFDWSRTSALPRSLIGLYQDEPLWMDLRWVGSDFELSPDLPRFQDAMLDIAAVLYGAPKDELSQEVFTRRRRWPRA